MVLLDPLWASAPTPGATAKPLLRDECVSVWSALENVFLREYFRDSQTQTPCRTQRCLRAAMGQEKTQQYHSNDVVYTILRS